MYFVNCTNSSSDSDVQIIDPPHAVPAPSVCSLCSSCPAASASTPTTMTMITETDVPGLPLHRLRKDGLLWAAYERGWEDAYAAALAAYAVHPPTSCAPSTPPPPPPQPPSQKLPPPRMPSPPTDSRPSTVGPVRQKTRANRRTLRQKVPSRPVQRSSVISLDTTTTDEILPYDEKETSKKKCGDWVNSIELNEQCSPEDVICLLSDVVSCTIIPQTPEEIEDALWQPLQDPCFRNWTTAETAAYKSAWLHIPSSDCCEHCVLKTYLKQS